MNREKNLLLWIFPASPFSLSVGWLQNFTLNWVYCRISQVLDRDPACVKEQRAPDLSLFTAGLFAHCKKKKGVWISRDYVTWRTAVWRMMSGSYKFLDATILLSNWYYYCVKGMWVWENNVSRFGYQSWGHAGPLSRPLKQVMGFKKIYIHGINFNSMLRRVKTVTI